MTETEKTVNGNGKEQVNPSSCVSRQFLFVALALAAVTMAVYAPVRQFEFLNFDDPDYVTANQEVLSGLTWQGVGWALTSGHAANWFPATWVSHMLDAELYGANPAGHHVTNLLLHIASTLLLFGVLRKMTGKMGRSAFVAALFAVHPLHVESVAWVAERKDVLSTLFAMLVLWNYARYVERPGAGRYAGILVLYALGLMAKPMLVTLPFVLLLLDVWPLGRARLLADSAGRVTWSSLLEQGPVIRKLVWEKLPLFALGAASSVVTFAVQQQGGAVGSLEAAPFDFRVANAVVSYVAYIGKMLWPAGLAAMYPFPSELAGWKVFGSLFVLIGVTVAALWAVQSGGMKRAYLPVGWFWYVGTLVPVIGLVQVGSAAMADRYTYVPLIGLFVIVAWGVPELLGEWPGRRAMLPAAAGVVICACAVAARSQVWYWQGDQPLWNHALEVTTGNYLAHHNLAEALAREGKLDEALAHYAEAIRLRPEYGDAYNNLGLILMMQRRNEEALPFFAEAVRLKPGLAEAHNNMGVALKNMGRLDEAIAELREALRIMPDHANAHYNLGNALALQGNTDEALAHYGRALELRPDNETIRRAFEALRGNQ